jgi:hypothetical protein
MAMSRQMPTFCSRDFALSESMRSDILGLVFLLFFIVEPP